MHNGGDPRHLGSTMNGSLGSDSFPGGIGWLQQRSISLAAPLGGCLSSATADGGLGSRCCYGFDGLPRKMTWSLAASSSARARWKVIRSGKGRPRRALLGLPDGGDRRGWFPNGWDDGEVSCDFLSDLMVL